MNSELEDQYKTWPCSDLALTAVDRAVELVNIVCQLASDLLVQTSNSLTLYTEPVTSFDVRGNHAWYLGHAQARTPPVHPSICLSACVLLCLYVSGRCSPQCPAAAHTLSLRHWRPPTFVLLLLLLLLNEADDLNKKPLILDFLAKRDYVTFG